MTSRIKVGGLQIEYRDLAKLAPNPRNARLHSLEQVSELRASMRRWGWTNPVLVDEHDAIIAGHGRVQAAMAEGMTQGPVIVLAGLSETEKRALAIADNKLALNSSWSHELLRGELLDLKGEGFDLGLTGFGPDELAALFADRTEGLIDPDDAPEPQADVVSRLGDVWVLGRHRLLCGDATVATDVERLLAGARPHLLVSDPPYGVEYDPAWRKEAGVSATKRTGKVTNDNRADWREAWALFPGDVAYVWHAALHATTVAESLTVCGFDIRAQIVWSKSHFVLGRGDYHWQHELCWYGVRKGTRSHWQGARDQSTPWSIAPAGAEDAATTHGTQKPVEAMRRPIVNNSEHGDLIYEPFSGSGTTIIAAEMTGRACHAIEIAPAYVDVCVRRWQAFTGAEAALEGDGRAFDAVAADGKRHLASPAVAAT